MKVAIFGGTGFVGNYIVDELIAQNMQPVVFTRPGSESKLRSLKQCRIVEGDISDANAIETVLSEVDAVIYNIGILREFPSKGITFEALQFQGVKRVIDVAEKAGVKRFILMSANGVKSSGTSYQTTKYRAEEYLKSTSLDWTVFRPSVLFGDPQGGMEFATQLTKDIIHPPIPAPLFYTGLLPKNAGAFEMSPTHVEDVAQAFVTALKTTSAVHQTFELGGPDKVSWKMILSVLAETVGKKKMMLPAPVWGVASVASLFDRFEFFPITQDQIQMLLEGNTCTTAGYEALGISPKRFNSKTLEYLVREK